MHSRPRRLLTFLLITAAPVLLIAACGKDNGAGNVAVVHENPAEGAEPEVDEASREALEKIANLGYVSGSAPAVGATGVTVYDREAAWPGLNFLIDTRSASAILMDMEGRVLHRWASDFERSFSGLGISLEESEVQRRQRESAGIKTAEASLQRRCWRRARLLPGGEVLAIFEGFGLIKLDRDSNIIWALNNNAHHHFDLDEQGNLYVLCREKEKLPGAEKDKLVILDYLRIYTPAGELTGTVSIDQAFRDSDFPAAGERESTKRDLYHTNTIHILDGRFADRHPAFSKGNLLLSFRSTDEIGVLDPAARKMVWVARGPWEAQHEATLLENGQILLFDNTGGRNDVRFSRILEFDPLSLEITWSYEGTPDNQLRSAIAGAVAKLPNGNVLIAETEQGRVLEVTRDKRIVWEYINPNTTEEDPEVRSAVADCVRIEPSFVADWLDGASTATLESAPPAWPA